MKVHCCDICLAEDGKLSVASCTTGFVGLPKVYTCHNHAGRLMGTREVQLETLHGATIKAQHLLDEGRAAAAAPLKAARAAVRAGVRS